MCFQKNSKALAPPPSGALPVRRVSGESAAGLPDDGDRGIDSSIQKQARAKDGSSAADSGDCSGSRPLWVPQDPGTAEARGLEDRKEAGLSTVLRRGSHAAPEAATEAMCGEESERARETNGAE